MPKSCKCILDTMVHKGVMTDEERDKILRNLKGIEWHPYPQEKPDVPNTKVASFGMYYTAYEFLVTQKLGTVSHVITSVYFNGAFQNNDVTAWAELPKPYEEGAEG